MLNFQTWLETPSAIRGILVIAQVSAYNTTSLVWETKDIYLSNIGYLTGDGITSFLPIITGGATFTESLSVDGGISMSFGDIEISNFNGEYDSWLDSSKFIWVNKPIEVYYGDPSVASSSLSDIRTSTFERVFTGIISDVDTRSRTSLNIKVRDKLERLNTPLSETKIGAYGTWAQGQTNQDELKPIVFGEVHNIEPKLVDPSLLEYLVSSGISESIIELRDNGIPIGISNYTQDLNITSFKLKFPSVGQLTVSVQGVKGDVNLSTGAITSSYVNTVAKLIALICLSYGNVVNRLLPADIDLANFNTFNGLHTQSVGLVISNRENVLSVCTQLANSVGAQLYFTRLGKLQLLKLGTYTSDPIAYITDSDILFHSLEVSRRTEVVASTKLGYCKNWTPQPSLLTNIPMTHKDMYGSEWYSTTATDNAVKSAYSLNVDPVQKDTLLLKESHAASEALRLNNLFKLPRTIYKLTCTANMLNLKLGQEVFITHNRFGLNSGKSGQVVSLSPNWLTSTIDIEVFI